ncbi:MAG: ABC-type transport auxiliary lipoprotein family protein [Novosphingobium sp.]
MTGTFAMRTTKILPMMLALALGGCLSLGGKVPPTLFSLTATATVPAGTVTTGDPKSAIMVMEPETDQRLAVNRVPVQIDDTNVAYVKNAAWIERPSRLFRALLAETLRTKTSGLVLEDDQAAANVGMRVNGRLIDMGYDARTSSVVVRFEAIRSTTGNVVVSTKRFESVVPGIEAKPEAIGPALNRAANDVAGQVASWVTGG